MQRQADAGAVRGLTDSLMLAARRLRPPVREQGVGTIDRDDVIADAAG
jgi:hypothetical protein